MQVVPVVDLMGGEVVRARMGDRASYRPIETPLSPTSDPVDVVRGLLALHAFSALYIADLDAILGDGDNLPALRSIRTAFPTLRMWIDNGAADAEALDRLMQSDLGVPVIGSESQRDAEPISQHANSTRVILSLDFRGDAFQGPEKILSEPKLWPRRVIVMTLGRVGSGAGPDLARLAGIRRIAKSRLIYAAGGVRNVADLAALNAAGAAGALIASALHDGRIGKGDLEALEPLPPDDQSFLPSGPNCLR